MSEILQEENPFVQQLVEQDDAEIKYIVCMWNNYGVEVPSNQLRKCLLAASPKNEDALMILQGEYDYAIRTIKSTM